jgi:hypothetical protein
MRSLLVLLLLAALGVGAYMSKPTKEQQLANADKFLADRRARDGDDIGDLIGGLIEGAQRNDSFEDMVVATKYAAKAGDKVLVECWGAFTQFLCSSPLDEKKKPG